MFRTGATSPRHRSTTAGSDLLQETAAVDMPRRRSLLICECLQNDFIAPIPPGKPAPNKLHIGRDEALRLVGADPRKGRWSGALGLHRGRHMSGIVHVRDWHDPDDPRQKAELEFFGPHCVMGTWGARFVDAIESYSRNRGRSAVVDATGINDFEDTPLADTLEP